MTFCLTEHERDGIKQAMAEALKFAFAFVSERNAKRGPSA